MYKRGARGWFKHVDFILVDAIILHLVLVLSYAVRFEGLLYRNPEYLELARMQLFSELFIFLMFDTMHRVLKRGAYAEFIETVRHCILVYILTMAIMFRVGTDFRYPQTILLSTLFLHIFVGYTVRIFWKWYILNHRLPLAKRKQTFAILDVEKAEKSIANINDKPTEKYKIMGIMLNGDSNLTSIGDIPVFAGPEDAAAFILQNSVDDIFIDCSMTDEKVAKLLDACK